MIWLQTFTIGTSHAVWYSKNLCDVFGIHGNFKSVHVNYLGSHFIQ